MTLLHPALLKSSGWEWSDRYRQLSAAKAWGCPSPGFYDGLSKTEKLDILAWYEIDWRVKAISTYEAQLHAQRAAKKKTPKTTAARRRARRR